MLVQCYRIMNYALTVLYSARVLAFCFSVVIGQLLGVPTTQNFGRKTFTNEINVGFCFIFHFGTFYKFVWHRSGIEVSLCALT